MPFLYIGSTGDRAGHSLTTWAVARRLKKKGLKVGFIKPFGTHPVPNHGAWIDHDAFLFKEVLQLHEPLERICPYVASDETLKQQGPEEIMAHFKSMAQELSEGKDILLVMGSRHIFFDDAACPIPDVSFVQELGADFLLVHRHRQVSRTIYSLLSVGSLLKEKVKGIILNRVRPEELPGIRNQMVPSLRSKGIPITAAIAEDPSLSFRSLREVGEVLEAELLLGEEDLGRPMGAVTVGSSDLGRELSLFKRAYNKIVLLQPSASTLDVEDSAPKPRAVAAILLTGGRSPAPQMVEAAKNAHVPLMVVKHDTFSALELLEQSTSHLSPRDEAKVQRFEELMDGEAGFDRLFESLGLFP